MNRIVFLTSLLFVVGLAPAARGIELDLTKYKIERVEMPMSPGLKRLYGWMPEYHLFDNVLHFDGLDSEVHLARSASMRRLVAREPEQAGLDPETLKIRWLDPGRLLWLTWGTVPQGAGQYSKEGDLVLLFDGQRFQELFRDSMYAYGRSGAQDSSQLHVDIDYDPSTAVLVLARTEVERGSSGKKGPLDDDEFTTDDGRTVYQGERRTRTVWRYRIENGQLRFVSGEEFADLHKDHSVQDVAEAFHVPVAKLVRLNPKLRGADRTSGTLCLDDTVGPYRREKDDGLCGDKPCPDE